MSASIAIAPRHPEDAAWIRETFVREWCGDAVAVGDGSVVTADEVPALIAWRGGARAGMIAYLLSETVCEIAAFVARPTGAGVGTALLEALVDLAHEKGCVRLEVATTNDNLDALRFYQRRGFRLIDLVPNKLEEVRARKPDTPLTGMYGIPLRDVLVLGRDLDD
jgi:ribosomal protein S18 acetylase RimI-like enzyme